MRKAIYTGIAVTTIISFLGGCATSGYQVYQGDMLAGKGLLQDKDYTEAKRYFQDAATQDRDSVALTYLAVVEYKTNNIESTLAYIQEAEKLGTDKIFYLRTMGYKALVLLRIDKDKGIVALKEYVKTYQYQYPLESIKEVQEMIQREQVDARRLEELIDEQVSTYENDVELYQKHGIGFYNRTGDGIIN